MARVEFIGGPLDGDVRDVPVATVELLFPFTRDSRFADKDGDYVYKKQANLGTYALYNYVGERWVS